MGTINKVFNVFQEIYTSSSQDILMWLFLFPISFGVTITIILRLTLIKGNLPEPIHKPWFGMLYILFMYILGVIAGSYVKLLLI
ncbi:hypothetical protein HN385_06505 [archaeon]|jgi:hypothetical protein|nr:hypothetical protein [archaeon]MBT3451130.1 hypothetical protein [archaeon]MBT6869534.1 hypothetical protein [archaeon]MBT7193699.1 hypothetical protein [archaeon]MBT7380390.1 hypothetical protein [archaeon]